MKTVNVHSAKTNFSKLLAEIEKHGEAFLICRNGEPVAELTPHCKKRRITAHPILSKFEIGYDPTETMTDEEWGRED